MPWPASERLDLAPAPAGLAVVQDLLNTRPGGRVPHPDLLATVASAGAWADEALAAWATASGRGRPRVRLTRTDVDAVRVLRDQLVVAVRGAGGDVPDALVGLVVRSGRGTDGTLVLDADGSGRTLVAGAVLLEVHRAQLLGTWRRLKTCRDETCPGTFFDRSPNNSGVWHDVRTCGNVANLRAARARRRMRTAPS